MAAKLIGERLPPNWSYAVTRDGRIFFIDDAAQRTSWLHPVTGQPLQTGHTTSQDLPPGWEQALTIEGELYFIDHNHHITTFEHPVSGHAGMEPPNRTPPQSPLSPNIKPGAARKSTSRKSTIKAPSASRGENSKVILRGWLQKQESGGLKLWKKKWCVLADFGLFFYKDDTEHNCIGSILLPSYTINACSPAQLNKKYAFKAEHENMKTFYFAAEKQSQMDTWVDALRMASLVQRAPGSGHIPQLIPKSPIMSWTDNVDSPGVVTPPDMQQYPFSGPSADTSRTGSELNDSYRDRSPHQPRDNTQNYNNGYGNSDNRQRHPSYGQNPNFNDSVNRSYRSDDQGSSRGSQRGSQKGSQRGSQSGSHAYNPSGDYGTLSSNEGQPGYQGQGNRPHNNDLHTGPRHSDPRYPQDMQDRNRGSQRSSQGQNKNPEDQRSRLSSGGQSGQSGQRPGQFSSSTLPRDMRANHPDNRGQMSNSYRGHSYNSLPRDSRSRLQPDEGPSSHSSPRQTLERPQKGHNQVQGQGHRRKDDSPYMMMTSPPNQRDNDRKMNPLKHSNRPLPQEPTPDSIQGGRGNKTGGGDYASLTRIRDKWPNQNLSDSGNVGQSQGQPRLPASQHKSANQPPDLYVDIPHTYVNVYDESQVRDHPPELPSRPPLPVEMRGKIVEDIAKTHSPNTHNEMIVAENNLELRMKQPAFFNYPTPTQESLPPLPQDSPRSQYSQRSQRSSDPRSHDQRSHDQRSDPRSHYRDGNRSNTLQPPRRPDVAPTTSSTEPPIVRHDSRDNYRTPNNYDQNYRVSMSSTDDSVNTLTEEDRNERISEFYGLGKYEKNRHNDDKNRIMSDLDVRTKTLPSKPRTGMTGERDFKLRSLPDHAQSMPSIYHEQRRSLEQAQIQSVANNSYANLGPPSVSSESKLLVGDENEDPNQRRSAFRPLSAGSNSGSKQRIPSGDNSMQGYPNQNPQEDYSKHSRYPDHDQTDVKRLSSASSQMSQPRAPWKQDSLPVDSAPQGHGKGQGQRGQRSAPGIHTVREEPDMPDSQVIETDLPRKIFPLNGPRLRMSISAGDLLGKTHDELVLLLIQLRRDKADLNEQRDGIRKTIEQSRPAEFYYRKMINEGRHIDTDKEQQHRQYMELKHKLEELEKKLEVYKPLINLVCNMVTMGSIYGGDNLMLATEYRKHLLSPEQYSPPKKMLEFSRRNQEDRVVKQIEEDVKQLTQEQADLEEKLDRLYDLDRIMQEQSFQVTSLKEDRELLEKALGGLLKKQDQNCTNLPELNKLIQQQRTIEKELSRVLQQLAEASKELEETTAENNKIEHDVALLRSKVHGDVSRSKSAPSLSSESLRTKMKMEKDLAKVQGIMEGLSEEGARLQEIMTSLRRPKSGGDPTHLAHTPTSPGYKEFEPKEKKKGPGSTYFETDMDSSETKDLAQVTALLASYKLIPGAQPADGDLNPEPVSVRSKVGELYGSPPPSTEEGVSAFKAVSPTHREEEHVYHASPVQTLLQQTTQAQLETGVEMDGGDQWDIGEADDNTKRFFGLIPKNMPKSQTVRDVKRNSESRKKKEEDPPPLKVGVVPSSDYTDSNFHVYENLPQQKSVTATPTESEPLVPTVPTMPKYPWSSVRLDISNPTSTQRRRSNLQLMAPKPFTLNSKPTPYSSVPNVSTFYKSDNIDTPTNNQITPASQSQLYSSSTLPVTDQSNASTVTTDPPTFSSKTPPTPPVRGTSKLVTAEVSQHNFTSLPQHISMTTTGRNFAPPEPSILRKGLGKNKRDSKNSHRYLTISSSQPVKLEQTTPTSPKLNTQAGDLISSMDVPDIVKSSTAKIENFDERTIDREILYFPEKVVIPERYMPDSDEEEQQTEEEKAQRREKADKIKRILTQQSVHSLSQPDVSKVAGEVHERVQQEKMKRAQLLGINQELAEQVKRKSRQFAAERRKTWSGTTAKTDTEEHNGDLSDPDLSHHDDDNNHSNNNYHSNSDYRGDTNNNSYTAEKDSFMDNSAGYYVENNSYEKENDSYMANNFYGSGDSAVNNAPYIDTGAPYIDTSAPYDSSYNPTSYGSRPNFKI